MTPTPLEARQLCRLRALRVERAEAQRNEAQAAADRALAAVQTRQEAIMGSRSALAALSRTLAGELALDRPRWQGFAAAERARLADRIERDEYALVGEERTLEEANARLYEAGVELARARAREDVVRDLAADARRRRSRERDVRAEVELEDRPRRMPA